MILDVVMRRKIKVLCMDDTLAVAARKMRDLNRVNSPLVCSFEAQDMYKMVQVLPRDPLPGLFISERRSMQGAESTFLQPE